MSGAGIAGSGELLAEQDRFLCSREAADDVGTVHGGGNVVDYVQVGRR